MSTVRVVIEVPEEWISTALLPGESTRLAVGGIFGFSFPVRVVGTLAGDR